MDEKALVKALADGEIAGAGLDVYEREPEITERLISSGNCVLLPHAGSATFETRSRMTDLAVENLLKFLRGKKPVALVNPGVYKEKSFLARNSGWENLSSG